jgi:hypothetical protein
MRTLRQRKYLFALLAILALLFAGCKAESPTAPPLNNGSGSGSGSNNGGTPPPSGSSVVITASNLNPVAGSVTAITVTVTQNNNPVPNGTAVELETTKGNFADPATGTSLGTATLLTTSNGKVVVNLTSDSAGAATVRAVVNNVASTLTVNFQTAPTDNGNTGTAPTISNVTPTFGNPAGGQTVTITGTNFRAPVRVLFDFGAPIGTKEAFVTSVTPTQITVVTPAVDLAGGQALPATIRVIVGAGAPGEATVSAPNPFNYQLSVLTPIVSAISPDSGPIDGGTRITIFGSGFQAPVQVGFAPNPPGGSSTGWTSLQVLNTTFNQIIAVTPPGRDVNPNGSGTLTGNVDIRVKNITSNTEAIVPLIFHYVPKMQITNAAPLIGPATGGTKVTIDGIGFNDPVAVTIGGVPAQPIRVSGTEIVAVTLALPQLSCSGTSGSISVTNIDNGDTATAPGTFVYRTPKPTIINVNPSSVDAGNSVSVTVAQALPGINKISIGDKTLFPTSATPTPDGTVTSQFGVTLPTATSFTFQSSTCTVNGLTGTQLAPLVANVTYLNVDTGCTDTASNALTINPPVVGCTIPPSASITSPSGSNCATPAASIPVGTPGNATITIANNTTTTQNLIINSAAITNANNATMTIGPGNATIAPGGTANFTVTITPTNPGSVSGTATFTSNDPAKQSFSVCINATGI